MAIDGRGGVLRCGGNRWDIALNLNLNLSSVFDTVCRAHGLVLISAAAVSNFAGAGAARVREANGAVLVQTKYFVVVAPGRTAALVVGSAWICAAGFNKSNRTHALLCSACAVRWWQARPRQLRTVRAWRRPCKSTDGFRQAAFRQRPEARGQRPESRVQPYGQRGVPSYLGQMQPLLEDLQRPSAVDKQVDHGYGQTAVARPPVRR